MIADHCTKPCLALPHTAERITPLPSDSVSVQHDACVKTSMLRINELLCFQHPGSTGHQRLHHCCEVIALQCMQQGWSLMCLLSGLQQSRQLVPQLYLISVNMPGGLLLAEPFSTLQTLLPCLPSWCCVSPAKFDQVLNTRPLHQSFGICAQAAPAGDAAAYNHLTQVQNRLWQLALLLPA